MTIKIAVVNESLNNETRVALVPEIAQKLASNNVSFIIERMLANLQGFWIQPTLKMHVNLSALLRML